jgi:hypothetical protein
MNVYGIHDTSIGAYIWGCCECDSVWRALGVEWCQCGQSEGIRLRLTPWRGECVERAIRVFDEEEFKDNGGEVRLASAMQEHSPWYDNNCPSDVQACWAYLRTLHPTPAVQRAMELFEIRFQTAIFNLDENGQRIAHEVAIHMG